MGAKAEELKESREGLPSWLDAFIQAKVPLPGKCNCTWCVPDEHGHNATCDVCKERFLTATGKTVCPDCRE